MKKNLFFVFFFYFLMLSLTSLEAADAPPSQEQSQQASVLEEKIRKENAHKKPGESRPVIIEEEKKTPAAAPEKALRFTVKKIEVEGGRIVPMKQLRALTAPYENVEHSLGDFEELAEKITRIYRQAGYITTTAYIPEQRLENKILRIRIVEGKIGAFQVEGNRFFRKKQILRYLRSKPGQPLQYAALRQGLNQLNQNRDREVRSILRRGKTPETTDVILKVKDHLPLHTSTLFDNQGSRSTGKKRYGFTLQDSNLTGWDDSALIGGVFGLHFGALFSRYELPVLPQYGTIAFAGFSHVQVDPQKELRPFGVNGISDTYSSGIRQPIFEKGRAALDTELGFDFKESRTKVLSGTFRRERLRLLHFSHNLNLYDKFGATRWEQSYGFGINGFGAAIHADPASARQGVEPGFFRWYGSLLRNQRMPFKTTLQVKASYQISSRKLPSSEGLYMGGASTVRGYPEGDYIADYGIFYNAEYGVPAFFIPQKITVPFSTQPLKEQIDMIAFFDEGYGQLRGPSGIETRSRHLAGIGGGLRVHLYKNIYARLEWARAVGDHSLTEQGSSAFHFRVQAEIP